MDASICKWYWCGTNIVIILTCLFGILPFCQCVADSDLANKEIIHNYPVKNYLLGRNLFHGDEQAFGFIIHFNLTAIMFAVRTHYRVFSIFTRVLWVCCCIIMNRLIIYVLGVKRGWVGVRPIDKGILIFLYGCGYLTRVNHLELVSEKF